MHELAPFIKDLAIILSVAGFVAILFQALRQPVVLGYLVAGMLVGPHTPPYDLLTDTPTIKTIAELGVIFLMFALGLEFSFEKLRRVGSAAAITALVEVFFMLAIGFGLGMAIGWSFDDSLFLGAALAISSTTIIIKALDELHLKGQHFAQLVFGILIVEDLLAILILAALSAMESTEVTSLGAVTYDILEFMVIVGSWILIGGYVIRPLFRRILWHTNQETLTILSVASCLLLVCVAAALHYSTALGAFMMGSVLAETRQVERIEKLLQPIKDIFGAVFFVSVGMLMDPQVIIKHYVIVLLVSFVTIVAKVVSTTVGARFARQNVNTSVRIGMSMAQIGEFSFIIVGMGTIMGVMSPILYPIIVSVSVITTFTTPYLMRASGPLSNFLTQHFSSKK